MQAKYRDTQRLESARSAMETEEAIARARAADRDAAATRDLAFRLAEIEREEEARRQEIARDQRLEEAKESARREREIEGIALDDQTWGEIEQAGIKVGA